MHKIKTLEIHLTKVLDLSSRGGFLEVVESRILDLKLREIVIKVDSQTYYPLISTIVIQFRACLMSFDPTHQKWCEAK